MLRLRDGIKINERFQSSVSLKFDLDKVSKFREFVPSGSSVFVLRSFLEDIFVYRRNRSVLLTGAYGRGKSHLLLVLLNLLLQREGKAWTVARQELLEKIRPLDPELVRILGQHGEGTGRYLPVVVSLGAGELERSYLLALHQALERHQLLELVPGSYFEEALRMVALWEREYPSAYQLLRRRLEMQQYQIEDFVRELREHREEAMGLFKAVYPELTAGNRFNPLLDMEVTTLYQETMEVLRERYGFDGMLVVFDEFSKFIEGEDSSRVSRDMKLIQDMCELCNSSGDMDIRQILIAHKSIREYGDYLPRAVFNSFESVEGRLVELPFLSSPQNYYELMGNVLQKTEQFPQLLKEYQIHPEELGQKAFSLTGCHSLFTREDYQRVIVEGCFPLHPMAVWFLVKISEYVGQNERTVFTFLAKEEACTLAAFVRDHQAGEDIIAGCDKIYDYFAPVFATDVRNQSFYKEYIKAEYIIGKLSKEDAFYPQELRLVKALALIHMLHLQEVPANDAVLQECARLSREELACTVGDLMGRGLLRYRAKIGSYVFSIRADVNLEEEIKNLARKGRFRQSLPEVLRQVSDQRYVLPKEYNQQRAMTRYFEYVYMTREQYCRLPSADRIFREHFADGKLIVICDGTGEQEERKQIAGKTGELREDRLAVLYPAARVDFAEQVNRYLAVEQLQRDKKFLQEYETAEEELIFYKDDLCYEINRMLEHNFAPKGMGVFVLHSREQPQIYRSGHAFQMLLTRLCNQYYDRTPVINHELVNRRRISVQTRRARGHVIERILQGQDRRDWLHGGSPEATIYRAALVATGVEVPVSEEASADASHGDVSQPQMSDEIREVLRQIQDFIRSAGGVKRSFQELYQLLQGEHYGMRDGVIPIYVAWCTMQLPGTPVLYVGDLEQRFQAEQLNQIDCNPAEYSLYLETDTAEKLEYFSSLERLFDVADTVTADRLVRLRRITDRIREWYNGVGVYARTAGMEETQDRSTIRLCRLLQRQSVNPRELLLVELPALFGTQTYQECYRELAARKEKIDGFYPALQEQMAALTKRIFGGGETDPLRTVLQNWWETTGKAAENMIVGNVAARVLRLVKGLESDHEEYIINALSHAVLGIYPENYKQVSVEEYHIRLEQALAELEQAQQRDGEKDMLSFVIRTSSGQRIERSMKEGKPNVHSGFLYNQIMELLEEVDGVLEKDQQIQVMLQALEEVADI